MLLLTLMLLIIQLERQLCGKRTWLLLRHRCLGMLLHEKPLLPCGMGGHLQIFQGGKKNNSLSNGMFWKGMYDLPEKALLVVVAGNQQF